MQQSNNTRPLKLLIIGDLHGQIPKIHFKEFDAIIVTGDFCLDEKIRKHIWKAYKIFLKTHSYPEWYDTIGRAKAKILIKDSLKHGRLALEKLNKLNVPIYAIPGNWDFADGDNSWNFLNKNYYKDYLIKGLKNVIDCHQKNIKIKTTKSNYDKTYNIIGYGLVNGPELLKYRNYKNIEKNQLQKSVQKYNKLITKYSKLFNKSKNPTILLSHNVPFNTSLDTIQNKSSPMNGKHYGSNLARDLIIKHKPILCVAGHMHEHYGTCKIGQTVVLNAGFGGKNNTLIIFKKGKITSVKFFGKKK